MAGIKFDSVTEIKKEVRMLFVGAAAATSADKPIAYSTEAGVSFSKDTIDTSNKMDGSWGTTLGGKKSAEISVSAFCAPSNATGTGESELYAAFEADSALPFEYCYVTVTEADDGSVTIEKDTSKLSYKGKLKISSLELTSDNGDVCKYSSSATSQGKVTKVAGV